MALFSDRGLLSLKLRFAFFYEGLHSFPFVFGGKEEIKTFSLEFQPFTQGCFEGLQDRFFGGLDGEWGFGGDFFGYPFGFLDEKFYRNNLGYQA